ncbi:hypothetical protein LGM58_37045 [Burkholderia contaminans]|uniref:hypothetical protein n=1 Tax=Burkholderia contaminans TaxID=488447 RepID=UPI001CF3F189|nr:hypothetical protein [Burkholderia contaminans]MCA7888791.1 hypothetical protein [Burkholderia contaminans]
MVASLRILDCPGATREALASGFAHFSEASGGAHQSSDARSRAATQRSSLDQASSTVTGDRSTTSYGLHRRPIDALCIQKFDSLDATPDGFVAKFLGADQGVAAPLHAIQLEDRTYEIVRYTSFLILAIPPKFPA